METNPPHLKGNQPTASERKTRLKPNRQSEERFQLKGTNNPKEAKDQAQVSKIDKIGLYLLYFSVTLEIIIVIIDKSNYTNPLEGQLFRITFLLAGGKVLCTKYSLKEWAALIMFGLLGLISYKITGRNEILRIIAFVAACKGTDVKKLLKYVFYLTTAGCLLLVFLSVTGIYGGLALETDFGRGYRQVRYCLGLGHPNALHCMFMMLVLLGLYLYHGMDILFYWA